MYQALPLIQLADAARIERRFDARPARSARSGRLVRNRHRSAASVAFVASALLMGCSDDDPATVEAAPAATDHASHPATTATDGESVEVVLSDYHFDHLPDEVPAGTELTVRNDSDTEVHELVAMRLAEGDDRPLGKILEGGMEELMALGMPALVIVAPPGDAETVTAVGDGHLTEPGRYLVICTIPTGADPDDFMASMAQSGDGPPQVEGGAPHFANGMVDDITVTA